MQPTNTAVSWAIGPGCALRVRAIRAGFAADETAAWTAALTASRTTLLAGELTTVTIEIDGEILAMIDPARDRDGRVDPAALTARLVGMYQRATYSQVVDLLTGHRARSG